MAPTVGSRSDLVLFRDDSGIDPVAAQDVPEGAYKNYSSVPPATFILCTEDIWLPKKETPVDAHMAAVVSRRAEQKKRRAALIAKIKSPIVKVLDHPFTLLLFTVMTVWALFLEEIRIAANLDKSVDPIFASISLTFMCVFLLEWIVRSAAQYEEYCFSFFWFLDIIATLSMVFDAYPILAGAGECSSLDNSVFRTLRSTTRLGRILRLLRVVRVVKIVAMLRQKRDGEVDQRQPSAVGKKLNEKIVQNVIVSVLVIMVGLPWLSIVEEERSLKYGLELLTRGYTTPSVTNYSADNMLMDYEYRTETVQQKDYYPISLMFVEVATTRNIEANSTTKLKKNPNPSETSWLNDPEYAGCFMNLDNVLEGCPKEIDELRCSFLIEVDIKVRCDTGAPCGGGWDVACPDENKCTARAIFDNSDRMTRDALTGIIMTLFIGILLFLSFMMYSQDVSSLVVRPIESMIDVVRKLAENPTLQLKNENKSKYETEAVRVALAKIVGLMQLGFGGAGHEIIAANLANADGQELDLMRRGKKSDCAYGFCDIRQFTDTVECLQDQVMLFTNSVGEIVHQSCHDNRGEPNKNIGDAFLIVWRTPKHSQDYTKLVDGALTAFRRCVREIAASQTLQLVTNVEAIHKKFGHGKYRTKLGFGLHFGWSVEGPVGTPTKIDCSYLSPEVKISERLEAATKIYSSNILMSGQFYDLLSDHIKVGIRLVDHITLKGGHKPFRVYADDRSNLWLKINPRLVEIYGAEAAYEQFSKTFHEGVDAFIKGDWTTATQKLEGATDFCPKDVPTKLLLKEMKKRSIDAQKPTAPVDWKGYHDSDV